MRVLLISPPIMDIVDGALRPVGVDAERECPPLGVYSLAATLQAAGHEVTVADLVLEGTRSIERYDAALDVAELVGIGATSMSWPTALDVLGQLRARRPDVPVVCGGIHPTLFDARVLRSFPVQYVVRGEGELALLQLCEALAGTRPRSEVANLSFLDDAGGLVRTAVAPMQTSAELGSLPLPDYRGLPVGRYKCLGIESSRGCVFDCAFCSTPYRKSWRPLSASAFVERLQRVSEQALALTSSGCVHVIDDEFTLNPARALAIARQLQARGTRMRLLYDARAQDLLHDGLVDALAPHTVCLLVGAECGYDEGLARVGKGSTCATLEAAAAQLARVGIAHLTDFSFILGLPWESRAEVERTIEFATRLFCEYGVHVVLQWYRQIPGSRIWDEARARQLVHEAMYDDYGFFRDLYLFRTSCQLSPTEIYEVADMADQLRWLSDLPGAGRPSIVHDFPSPIRLGFPRDQLEPEGGLSNLRAIANTGHTASRSGGEG